MVDFEVFRILAPPLTPLPSKVEDGMCQNRQKSSKSSKMGHFLEIRGSKSEVFTLFPAPDGFLDSRIVIPGEFAV